MLAPGLLKNIAHSRWVYSGHLVAHVSDGVHQEKAIVARFLNKI